MSTFTERSSRKIDMVFVLALLALFTATALTLVLIGAKQYASVTDDMTANHEQRIASSYLAEKVRQNDREGSITLCTIMDTPALSILTTEGNISYITYIYFYEDYLRELVVTKDSVFSLTGGQPIMNIGDIQFTMENDTLIRAEVTDLQGYIQTMYFPIHSTVRKEDV